MASPNDLELVALHRAGGDDRTERWSWDFVVDGRSLRAMVGGDVAGVLGWGDREIERESVARLLVRSKPDLNPDRVALYVCPECGDLDCGAVMASVVQSGDLIEWKDFAWDRPNDPGNVGAQPIAIGPFRFDRSSYARVLSSTIQNRPGPHVSLIREPQS